MIFYFEILEFVNILLFVQMGITEIFKPSADLTDLLESNDPLQVTDVVHKAFIEVNEEGTVAAAATGTV